MKDRAEMLAYKNTVGNHSPANAQCMSALLATMAQILSNRLGVQAWVDHADIWLSVHLSASCTALEALRDILKYLRNPTKFSQYRVANLSGAHLEDPSSATKFLWGRRLGAPRIHCVPAEGGLDDYHRGLAKRNEGPRGGD
jgi:hypothetical protein